MSFQCKCGSKSYYKKAVEVVTIFYDEKHKSIESSSNLVRGGSKCHCSVCEKDVTKTVKQDIAYRG